MGLIVEFRVLKSTDLRISLILIIKNKFLGNNNHYNVENKFREILRDFLKTRDIKNVDFMFSRLALLRFHHLLLLAIS